MNTGNKVSHTTMIVSIFIWVGMVCAISFLESWLKFQAPGISVDLGVGIGRLVFAALNKVEIMLAVIILFSWWQSDYRWRKHKGYIAFGIVAVVLLIQTFVLLPIMDTRATLRLEGVELPKSYLHFYYVGGEFIKVFALAIFGIKTIH